MAPASTVLEQSDGTDMHKNCSKVGKGSLLSRRIFLIGIRQGYIRGVNNPAARVASLDEDAVTLLGFSGHS
jgi:hypothetical protein